MEKLPEGEQLAGSEALAANAAAAPSLSPLPHRNAGRHRLLLHFGEAIEDPGAVAADVNALAGGPADGRFSIEAVAASEAVALAITHCISAPALRIEVLPIAPSVPNPGTLALAEHQAAERLSDRISRAEIVLAWGGTALLDRAVKALAAPPPIILCGKHASRRAQDDAPAPPPDSPGGWRQMIEEVLAARTPAPAPAIFQSFLQGGFECSTHRLASGKRLDLIAAIGHDTFAEADYLQAQEHGMRTLRDGVRWHLIERTPGKFDFSSLTPMMDAARRTGTQIIWDLLHYGWPDDLDAFGPDFVPRFTAFAEAAARHRRKVDPAPPFWCPVNEISFLAWAGGDHAYLNPFAHGRGQELKIQLARASIKAMQVLRKVDRRARFVYCEPIIAIHHDALSPDPDHAVERMNAGQFEAWDLISGRAWPQLGGKADFLDVIGVNYYFNNQWIHGTGTIDLDHPAYLPLSTLLAQVHARYGRPILIAETGIEGARRTAWFDYVSGEVLRARAAGVPVEGICLYPVANHPGWDDDRLCPNGLFGHVPSSNGRSVHRPLASAMAGFSAKIAG